MDRAEINRRFDHHAPDQERARRHNAVRAEAKIVASVWNFLPEGREKELAFTALEEALFWANAAVAREGK